MPAAKKTISQVFDEFLADQEARLSPRTFSKYESIIDLFRSYLESYWPGHTQEDYDRVTSRGGTFCDTFGPAEISYGYSEFLSYFMPRKVMGGKETMKAAGTVTKKLAEWLAETGYAEETGEVQERATKAARELPATQEMLDRLEEFLDLNAPDGFEEDFEDRIEDHFEVTKLEPGKLWLEPLTRPDEVIGPVPVPEEVTDICGETWDIGGIAVKTPEGWRLWEVWNTGP